MNSNEMLDSIYTYIEWYRENGNTASINDLLDCRDTISTWCYNLAEKTGDEKTDYNMACFIRTIEVSRTKQALIKKGSKIGHADIQALIENEGLFKQEIIHESYAFKLDLLLKSAYKVLDAISQRVSYLKVEESNTKYQNQT